MVRCTSEILGKTWEVNYAREAAQRDSVMGATYFPRREIWIRDDVLDKELKHVITHELTHAFIAECGQNQNQLLTHVFDEEFIAEFVAIHAADIVANSKEVYRVILDQRKRERKIKKAINADIDQRSKEST